MTYFVVQDGISSHILRVLSQYSHPRGDGGVGGKDSFKVECISERRALYRKKGHLHVQMITSMCTIFNFMREMLNQHTSPNH